MRLPGHDTVTDHEQLEQITATWEEYDRTSDASVIADFLAEDIRFLPPGRSPIEGKEAAMDYLDRPDRAGADIDQWPEDIIVGDDLAVVHVSVEGTRPPEEGDEPEEVNHKGLDVYRRDRAGNWEQIFSIWNDQI